MSTQTESILENAVRNLGEVEAKQSVQTDLSQDRSVTRQSESDVPTDSASEDSDSKSESELEEIERPQFQAKRKQYTPKKPYKHTSPEVQLRNSVSIPTIDRSQFLASNKKPVYNRTNPASSLSDRDTVRAERAPVQTGRSSDTIGWNDLELKGIFDKISMVPVASTKKIFAKNSPAPLTHHVASRNADFASVSAFEIGRINYLNVLKRIAIEYMLQFNDEDEKGTTCVCSKIGDYIYNGACPKTATEQVCLDVKTIQANIEKDIFYKPIFFDDLNQEDKANYWRASIFQYGFHTRSFKEHAKNEHFSKQKSHEKTHELNLAESKQRFREWLFSRDADTWRTNRVKHPFRELQQFMFEKYGYFVSDITNPEVGKIVTIIMTKHAPNIVMCMPPLPHGLNNMEGVMLKQNILPMAAKLQIICPSSTIEFKN